MHSQKVHSNAFPYWSCRLTHPGEGIPSHLIEDMYNGRNQWTTPEGLGLKLSRKLLIMMNGRVRYVRENSKCFFVIDLELKTRGRQKM